MSKSIKELREKYPYIVKWSHMMGSYDPYIERQLERAEETNAPTNATYEKHDSNGPTGEWATTDTCTNPDTRRTLGLEDK